VATGTPALLWVCSKCFVY